MSDLTSIHERLAKIETTQEHTSGMLEKIDGKLDGISSRVRDVELNSAKYGTLAGGVISVAVAFVSAKLKGI
jgi:hypothetical protein